MSQVSKDCQDEGLDAVKTEKECEAALPYIRRIHIASALSYGGLKGNREGRTGWCYFHGSEKQIYFNRNVGSPNNADYQICKDTGITAQTLIYNKNIATCVCFNDDLYIFIA